MANTFDITGIDDFVEALAGFNDPLINKRAKRFFMKEGNKLAKQTRQLASVRVKRDTGDYLKGIKRGKVYLYNGDTWAIRVYNTQPHAHLVENGHEIVTKSGERTGKYVTGKKVFETAERRFQNEFFEDVEKFVDEILDEGLGF